MEGIELPVGRLGPVKACCFFVILLAHSLWSWVMVLTHKVWSFLFFRESL